jgi:hypothetical protein
VANQLVALATTELATLGIEVWNWIIPVGPIPDESAIESTVRQPCVERLFTNFGTHPV